MSAAPDKAALQHRKPPFIEGVEAVLLLFGECLSVWEVPNLEPGNVAVQQLVDHRCQSAIRHLLSDCCEIRPIAQMRIECLKHRVSPLVMRCWHNPILIRGHDD